MTHESTPGKRSYFVPATVYSSSCGSLVSPLTVTAPDTEEISTAGRGPAEVEFARAIASPFRSMKLESQQAVRCISLPPELPDVWIKEPRPVTMPPQQVEIAMLPGTPLLPVTKFGIFLFMVTGPPASIRMSPDRWLTEWVEMTPPGWTSTLHVVRIRRPGPHWLFPEPTGIASIEPVSVTMSGREPRSKSPYQVSGVDPSLTNVK